MTHTHAEPRWRDDRPCSLVTHAQRSTAMIDQVRATEPRLLAECCARAESRSQAKLWRTESDSKWGGAYGNGATRARRW